MAKRAAAAANGGGGGGTARISAPAAANAANAAARAPSSSSSSSLLPRLRENLAVGTYIYFIPAAFALNLAMILCHRYTRWLWLIWTLAINFGPPARAAKLGRWPKPFRFALALWRPLRDYFPAALHKTADLDPQQRYLFVAAPHGLVTMFVWVAFDTDATDFSAKFPGVDVVPLTLEINFRLPLVREFLLLHGIGDASMAACLSLLGRGPGSAILLAAGGAEESLLAEPGTMDLVLAKRKGFVKVALRTGALLVPVIGFGENELYGGKEEARRQEAAEAEAEARQAAAAARRRRLQEGRGAAGAGAPPGPPRSLRAWSSRALKRAFGFVLPEIRGVGPLGLMPRRSPLDVVIGAPVAFDERRALGAARDRRAREAETRAVAAAVQAKAAEGRGDEAAAAEKNKAPAAAAARQEQEQEGDDEYAFEDMVDAYHAQYIEALKALYDAHKERFAPRRTRDLQIAK